MQTEQNKNNSYRIIGFLPEKETTILAFYLASVQRYCLIFLFN